MIKVTHLPYFSTARYSHKTFVWTQLRGFCIEWMKSRSRKYINKGRSQITIPNPVLKSQVNGPLLHNIPQSVLSALMVPNNDVLLNHCLLFTQLIHGWVKLHSKDFSSKFIFFFFSHFMSFILVVFYCCLFKRCSMNYNPRSNSKTA